MRTQLRRQRGFVNFPDRFFETLLALAAVGLIAVLVAAGYGLWWLVTHVRFV